LDFADAGVEEARMAILQVLKVARNVASGKTSLANPMLVTNKLLISHLSEIMRDNPSIGRQ